MDSLSYRYDAGTNRLNYVKDSVPDADYGTAYVDMDRQSINNNAYDSIGNLVKDDSAHITNISWNVYGKITSITYNNTANTTIKNLNYYYDAAGNRTGKKAEINLATGTYSYYTWYVRDASGNVMATYLSSGSGSTTIPTNLLVKERHLYGSSRLGI